MAAWGEVLVVCLGVLGGGGGCGVVRFEFYIWTGYGYV